MNVAAWTDARRALATRGAEHATKLVLIATFLGGVAAFTVVPPLRRTHVRLGWIDLLMLGLTTYRVGNMVAYERIADPLREPFAERRPDPETGEEEIAPRGRGARRALGELFTCPTCVGTWAAAGVVYGLHIVPAPTRAFMAIMSATAIAQVVRNALEALRSRGGS